MSLWNPKLWIKLLWPSTADIVFSPKLIVCFKHHNNISKERTKRKKKNTWLSRRVHVKQSHTSLTWKYVPLSGKLPLIAALHGICTWFVFSKLRDMNMTMYLNLHCDLNNYHFVYCAIISNTDEESTYISLRPFIIVLYKCSVVMDLRLLSLSIL